MTNIYDRLYQNHTASSRAKRQPGAERVDVAPSAYDHPHNQATTTTPPTSSSTTTKTTTQTTGASTSDEGQETGDGNDGEEGDGDPPDKAAEEANAHGAGTTATDGVTRSATIPPAVVAPLPQIILHGRDKTYTRTRTAGCSLQISEDWLRQSGQSPCDKAVQEQLTYQIMEGLFRRDFCDRSSTNPPGKHWDVDGATVQRLPMPLLSGGTNITTTNNNSDDANATTDENKESSSQSPVTTTMALLAAEKSATWDWKDIYSVAQAKAKIRLTSTATTTGTVTTTIHVQDYNYYVAG